MVSRRVVLLGVLVMSLGFAAPARATSHTDPIGMTTDNRLVGLDYENLSFFASDIPITGLQAGETMLGIDISPGGTLFGIAGPLGDSARRLYTINPATGAATAVGSGFTIPGNFFGFDVRTDRALIVSADHATVSVDLGTGAATPGPGVFFSGGGNPDVFGLARSGTDTFGIDRTAGALVKLNEATGELTFVGGPLGAEPAGLGSFDIANDGTTITVLDDRAYSVNLSTGGATLLGTLPQPLNGITFKPFSAPATGPAPGPGPGQPPPADLGTFRAWIPNQVPALIIGPAGSGVHLMWDVRALGGPGDRYDVNYGVRYLPTRVQSAQRGRPRAVVIARGKTSLRGGQRKRLKVPATRAGKRLLRGYKGTRLSTTLTLKIRHRPATGTGQTKTLKGKLNLRVKRPRR